MFALAGHPYGGLVFVTAPSSRELIPPDAATGPRRKKKPVWCWGFGWQCVSQGHCPISRWHLLYQNGVVPEPMRGAVGEFWCGCQLVGNIPRETTHYPCNVELLYQDYKRRWGALPAPRCLAGIALLTLRLKAFVECASPQRAPLSDSNRNSRDEVIYPRRQSTKYFWQFQALKVISSGKIPANGELTALCSGPQARGIDTFVTGLSRGPETRRAAVAILFQGQDVGRRCNVARTSGLAL